MISLESLKLTVDQSKEMPMVDLAFMILKTKNEPMYYRELMQEVSKLKGFSGDQMMEVIAQLYTEINIDGRFACVGNNLWGLIRWYPLDKGDEIGGNRPRIINDVDDDLDDEDLYGEEEDDDFSSDDEDYDTVNEDRDEIFEDEAEEEIAEIEEDEVIEDGDDLEDGAGDEGDGDADELDDADADDEDDGDDEENEDR